MVPGPCRWADPRGVLRSVAHAFPFLVAQLSEIAPSGFPPRRPGVPWAVPCPRSRAAAPARLGPARGLSPARARADPRRVPGPPRCRSGILQAYACRRDPACRSSRPLARYVETLFDIWPRRLGSGGDAHMQRIAAVIVLLAPPAPPPTGGSPCARREARARALRLDRVLLRRRRAARGRPRQGGLRR